MSGLDEMMKKDGFVPAAEVAKAIGRTLPTIHQRLKAEKIPGRQVEGRYWFVDVHAYLAECELPKDSTAYDELKKLAATVKKPRR